MESGSSLAYRALNGDGEAFGALVKMYRVEVYAIALSMAGNATDAEDLAQEAFIKAYLNLSQLNDPEKFGAWLRRIVRNHCRDWLRANAQQYLFIDDFSGEQLTFPPADERILNEDFGRTLALALSSLKVEDEQILRLFYVYGFKYDEITRVSGLSYSAAASRLHKAKKRIKTLIDDYIPPSRAGSEFMALSGGVADMKLGFSTDILEGIRAVEHAQGTEVDKRPFLCGVHLRYTQADGLRLIATDGRRLAMAQLQSNGEGENMSMTIPTEELGILKEALGQKSADISVERIDENMAAFYVDDVKKLIKLKPGTFPDYGRIVESPRGYTESVTIERGPAIDLMEKVTEAGKGPASSDWIQWGDVLYISPKSDILLVQEVTNNSTELCRMLLRFINESTSPEELYEKIVNHLPREEYQKLLNELERRAVPPSEPVGVLKIMASEGEARFVGRFNSYFLRDALKAMTCHTVKMRYRMEAQANAIPKPLLKPLLLEDDTDNIHVIMPMKGE